MTTIFCHLQYLYLRNSDEMNIVIKDENLSRVFQNMNIPVFYYNEIKNFTDIRLHCFCWIIFPLQSFKYNATVWHSPLIQLIFCDTWITFQELKFYSHEPYKCGGKFPLGLIKKINKHIMIAVNAVFSKCIKVEIWLAKKCMIAQWTLLQCYTTPCLTIFCSKCPLKQTKCQTLILYYKKYLLPVVLDAKNFW